MCSVRQAAWHRQSWQLEFQSLPDRHITTVKCTPGLLCLSACTTTVPLSCPYCPVQQPQRQLAQLAGCRRLVVSAALLLAFAPLLSKSYIAHCGFITLKPAQNWVHFMWFHEFFPANLS